MNGKSKEKKTKISEKLYRLIDCKQPEVKWAFCVTIISVSLLKMLAFYQNFCLYEDVIVDTVHVLAGGIIALIGVAVAGVAIVIALFSPEQVKIIEKVKPGSFEKLLYDFKWFGLVTAVETVVLIFVAIVIRSPYPIVAPIVFYIISFIVIYSILYSVFYGSALIGNCIKLAKIKYTLDFASIQPMSIPFRALTLQVEFLAAKLVNQDKAQRDKLFAEFIEIVQKSSLDDREEILQYLKSRYYLSEGEDAN